MTPIVEISETGTLQLPKEFVQLLSPHTRFRVELENENRLILSPLPPEQPFWATASPEERVKHWQQWVRSHNNKNSPNLSDEALRRENIYE
ncbi:hypothetical protein PN462_22750 [Spirulina sp. CS-785/01]|uniref:hypothetical protein n=1 Tax=Spirulina sp. CS-785/01 TaxID=3021716 RepID=UPI00232C3B83|nr:hypothetical protein [Spirulina sp. CS-785/01]MDB9315950.1 hypothetical protein [Spirulina sp. CS-785/01]